jgi:maltose alpha-D-glucosyltransferase/alpha-amylase
VSQDPLWYKDAVFYELHVKAYHDSDGDGGVRVPITART